jgi:hypothetical protein
MEKNLQNTNSDIALKLETLRIDTSELIQNMDNWGDIGVNNVITAGVIYKDELPFD